MKAAMADGNHHFQHGKDFRLIVPLSCRGPIGLLGKLQLLALESWDERCAQIDTRVESTLNLLSCLRKERLHLLIRQLALRRRVANVSQYLNVNLNVFILYVTFTLVASGWSSLQF